MAGPRGRGEDGHGDHATGDRGRFGRQPDGAPLPVGSLPLWTWGASGGRWPPTRPCAVGSAIPTWTTPTGPRSTCPITGGPTTPSPPVTGRCCTGGGSPPGPRPGATVGSRTWLQLDGVFYQGDVWLDGSYLGDTEGYFFPHAFEVTDAVAQRGQHLLALELACDPPADKAAKRNLTGVFQDWDCIAGDWNPGGIWRPVRLVTTGAGAHRPAAGPVHRRHRAAGHRRAAGLARRGPGGPGDAHDGAAGPVGAGGRAGDRAPVGGRGQRGALAGARRAPRPVVAPRPGRPAAVRPHRDHHRRRGGQRRAGPAHRAAPGADAELRGHGQRRAAVLEGGQCGPDPPGAGRGHHPRSWSTTSLLAREAGLDLLRVHGHISRPELYDAADRLGVLLWQDLPLQGGYAGVRQQAVRQAREAVDLLGHHPSVALWCGHNEAEPQAVPARRLRRPDGCGRPGACCRRGTSRSSTGRSSGRWRRPTGPGRSWPTPACCPTPPGAPTATCTTGGTAATSGTCPSGWPVSRSWPGSCRSSGPRRCPTRGRGPPSAPGPRPDGRT